MNKETNLAQEAKKALIESWEITEGNDDFFGELIFHLKERGFVIQTKQYAQEQVKEEVKKAYRVGYEDGKDKVNHNNPLYKSAEDYCEKEVAPKYK